jgi:predicted GNAT family acetyltransferase
LKIVSIENGLEQTFWNHVNQNILDYYFFILDLKEQREKTKITLATEGKKVKGLMLVYADYIVQLRGTRNAVKLLLDSVDLEKVELQAPLDCEDIVLGKYKPHARHELVLMSLRKGEENIQINRSPISLNVEDAEEVAEIMRKADPEWWGDITAERQKESLEKTFWLGIRRDQRIVSVGNTRFVDFGCNIGVIATDERYRNMGYAASIVSALVQEILKRPSAALIHVLCDNAPAIHVYRKAGFKPFKHYLLVRAEKTRN